MQVESLWFGVAKGGMSGKSLARLTAVRQLAGSILEGGILWDDSFLSYSGENYSMDLCYIQIYSGLVSCQQ